MSRKIYLNVTVRLVVDAEEGLPISDFISEMDYSFLSNTEGIDVLDTEVLDYEVKDSR